MNIYLVVEDTYGISIYSKWVKYINPQFRFVKDIREVNSNNIFAISGLGLPQYFEVIENAIDDVNNINTFDRLVVAVDSEEMSFLDRFNEINSFILSKKLTKDYKIIIQHFCIETWALGNRVIVSRNPQSPKAREYRNIFDVQVNDPELLPSNPREELNRSQFAEKYLRVILNERYRNLSYSKNNPKELLNRNFFDRVKSRFVDTDHIKSFDTFLKAFI